ncbi:tyrosine-type recombinase/integrase [Mucilaginibacter flavus]|uniref:tyrosine-type recombinase/integrase n=1 Tax=Mucilaginibacter flavus TaxID=931504 RepID=UPI0025B472DD|nr:tyrosine-type recombinase/integrase [Mucilaginibacter flavus]MDN3583830.1 tyrosine-type recombinase/integrase [Mucilaginibacter flavus]
MSRKYKPSPETAIALKAFETYLHNEQYGNDYIRQNKNYAGTFLEWITDHSLTPVQVTHADMMEFADQIRNNGSSIRLINQTMLAVRYYYAWLQHDGHATHNPAAGIILKGTIRNVPHDLLTKTELEALYERYEVKDNRTYRNKVMVGLLVYQALTRDELERLRPEHLKLREGKINVPAVGRQLSRILALQPHQILELHEYLLVVRPAILAERMNERPGRKPGQYKNTQEISRLFISINSVESMKNSLLHLNYALRKLNPKYKHAKQIRQSVITEWLKEKNIRTVQYMAGHRYVSSTERYKTTNLEDLKEALNKYHPLSL